MACLLLLPDELKIKIFEYLSGVDKIELLKVCKELYRVGVDKVVIQYLNFANNYKLSIPQLKFIARKQTVSQVTKINLNGIHWIPSAQLRDTLSKFLNLTALYVLDTQLSYRDLVKVLETTTKVRKLALSMKPNNSADVFKVNITLPITHLYVTYKSYSIRPLLGLLKQFIELKELWIVEPKKPVQIKIQEENPLFSYLAITLPTVSKKIVFSKNSKVPEGLQFLDALKDRNKNWKTWINFEIEDAVFCVSEDKELPHFKISCLDYLDTKLYRGTMDLQINKTLNVPAVEEAKKQWSELNIRVVNVVPSSSDYNADRWLYTNEARKIRKMKCESRLFWSMRDEQEKTEDTALFKKRRIGIGSKKSDENCKFAQFTKYATELDEFEIIDTDIQGIQDKLWHIENLSFAQNWKILKKLTITSVNIHSGKFLIDITKNCPMLNCLKIQDDLIQDNLSASLCQALQYATNLKDLRYERKLGIPVDQIIEALTKCSKLERLYVKCRHASKISKKPLETMITRCENLVFLFIFISELPETVCKSIKQSIYEFGVKPQQIISIRGQSYDLKNIMYEDIPDCHIEDIVCQENNFHCDYMRSFFMY